jgi:predicted Zn-dependent peptidase
MRGIKRVEFENGLTLLMERRPYTKETLILVGTKTGSVNESEENSGITHFIEHMLFRTNKWRTTQEISEELESTGARVGAETDNIEMYFYAKTLPSEIPKTLQIIYETAISNQYLKEEFLTERENVLSEIEMYNESPGDYIYDTLFLPTLFKGTPLEKPIGGTIGSVSKFTPQQTIAFKQEFCVPELVVVVGKFNEQILIETVARTFGSFPKRESPELSLRMPLKIMKAKKIEARSGIDQAYFNLGFRTPGSYHKDWPKLVLIQGILALGLSSRLFKKLRNKMGVGYVVDVIFESFGEIGSFCVYVIIKDPKRIEDVEEAIVEEFRDLKANLVSEKELTKAKNMVVREYYDSLEHIENRAIQLMRHEFQKIPRDYRKLEYYVRRLSPKSIRKTAQKYLTEDYVLAALVPPGI